MAGQEKPALGIKHHFRFAVAKHFQGGALGIVVGGHDAIEILAENRVWPDVQGLPDRHFFLNVLVERHAGDADKDQHHSEVHHVAAVAASVTHGQFAHSGDQIRTVASRDHSRASDKFRQNRECHKHAENQANERVNITKAQHYRYDPGQHTSTQGPRKVSLQGVE